MKPTIFISHTHAEAEVASWLKNSVSDLLLGAVEFFVSSDGSSIVGGDRWLLKIEEALKTSSVLLVLCSKDSVCRPWINFEAGGAWMAGKRVIPVCHAGMSGADLPEPLKSLQAYELSNVQHFQDLVGQLAHEAGLRPPRVDPKLMDSIPRTETTGEWELIQIPETGETVGTGCLEPVADPRDLTMDHELIRGFKKNLRFPAGKKHGPVLPPSVDLRPWCSEVRNQGKLNSSAAHAVAAMIEYFDRRGYSRSSDLSRQFIYKQARNLIHTKGDSGATLRSTLRAVRTCGVPPTEYWPYSDAKADFDVEPPASVYAMGFNYHSVLYFCHDPVHINCPTHSVLEAVKALLAAGIPSVFGVLLFPSFSKTNQKGGIPLPCREEESKWRQALLAVGYDDAIKIKNTMCGTETMGALLVQNSWGEKWGDGGYGWIPYEYVREKHASDFWSILSPGWIDTGEFGL